MESRIKSLEGVLRDWGYEFVDNWWRDGAYKEAHGDKDDGPHQPVSSNRVTEGEMSNTVRRESLAATEVRTEDISAVAANVASRAPALNVSLMAKAYENLVIPSFPSSG